MDILYFFSSQYSAFKGAKTMNKDFIAKINASFKEKDERIEALEKKLYEAKADARVQKLEQKIAELHELLRQVNKENKWMAEKGLTPHVLD
jgi:septal ring factor EnvC (AmiA/AmiB activator)